MVLRTAVTFDMSKLIDPTIEMWSSVDDPKRVTNAPIDYWYAAKSFTTPKGPIALESEIPRESTSMNFDCFPLDFVRDFWRLQDNATYTGLDDSALMMCRDFFEEQLKLSTARSSNEETIAGCEAWKEARYSSFQSDLSDRVLLFSREFLQFQESQSSLGIDDNCLSFIKEFWQFQESQSLLGIGNTRLTFLREFWQFQESQSLLGIDDTRLSFIKEFWQFQESQSFLGIDDACLPFVKEFWQFQESQSFLGIDDACLLFVKEFWQFQESQSLLGIDDACLRFVKEFWQFQESQSFLGIDDTRLSFIKEFWRLNTLQVSKGLSDGAIINCRKFLKNQDTISVTGLHDDLLTAFTDFWEGVSRAIENDGIKDNGLLVRKELWGKEMVLDEINNCIKLCNGTSNIVSDDNSTAIVASLRKLRLDMLTTLRKKQVNFELISKEQHLTEINNLQKTIGCLFEKLDGISQSIDQGLVNDKSKIDEVEAQHYQLLSKNAKLALENQELVSNFIKSQEELIASNANLHRIVSTMEKNTEKYLEENCQMQNIIRKLNKRLSSTSTNCAVCSIRSRGSRRRNSFSKKRHVESNPITPSSLDLIYVDC